MLLIKLQPYRAFFGHGDKGLLLCVDGGFVSRSYL